MVFDYSSNLTYCTLIWGTNIVQFEHRIRLIINPNIGFKQSSLSNGYFDNQQTSDVLFAQWSVHFYSIVIVVCFFSFFPSAV